MSLVSIFDSVGNFFTGAGKDVEKAAVDLGLSAAKIKDFWGVALGAAEVVEVVDPTLSPLIVSAMALAGPIVADIEAGLSTAQQLVTLADAAVNLQLAAAPKFTVVANKPGA